MLDFLYGLFQVQGGDADAALILSILICLVSLFTFTPRVQAADYTADWTGWTSSRGNGKKLRAIGDINGDEVPDVGWCMKRQLDGLCRVYLIDGADGTTQLLDENTDGELWGNDMATLSHIHHNDPSPGPDTTLIIVAAPVHARWKYVVVGCCSRYRGALYIYRVTGSGQFPIPSNLMPLSWKIIGDTGTASVLTDIGGELAVGDFDHDGSISSDYSVTNDADWNGDGEPDLAVGRQRQGYAGSNHSVIVVSGKAIWDYVDTPPVSDPEINSVALATLTNSQAGQTYGGNHGLAWVDNFRGNGKVGVLVGDVEYNTSNDQHVWLFESGDGLADVTWTHPNSADDQFGWSVAMIGDVNGDTYTDIALGDTQPATSADSGHVYIYYGGSSVPTSYSDAETNADVVLTCESGYGGTNTHFGHDIRGLGDINGDGHDDFSVAATTSGTAVNSRVYLFTGITDLNDGNGGPPDGIDDNNGKLLADQFTAINKQSDCDGYRAPEWGNYVAPVGDLNQDGYNDLVSHGYANCGTHSGQCCGLAFYCSPDANSNGIMDIQEAGYTGAGSPSSATLTNGWGLTFDNVSSPGFTSATDEDPCSENLGDVKPVPTTSLACVNLTSTASYSGNIEICAPYNEADVIGPETGVKLYHWNGTSWDDVTTSVDIVNNIVCGNVTSLSPFVIGQGCCVGIAGNVDGDAIDEINIADVTYLVTYAFKNGPAPPCADEGNINGVGDIDISDVTALVSYMFKNGPDPASCP